MLYDAAIVKIHRIFTLCYRNVVAGLRFFHIQYIHRVVCIGRGGHKMTADHNI